MNSSNNSGGATKPKTGEQLTPLKRGKGYTETMNAMGSKTRSTAKGTDKHNRWEGAGDGQGGNVRGYQPE